MAELDRAHVETLRRLVGEHAGLEIPEERAGELADIVAGRIRAAGAGDADTYLVRLATNADGGRELARIVEGLVVHETYFFRDRAQLEALAGRVLPERARARAGRPIRILSAGASTGAEAYTIAILIRERYPALAATTKIVGIDLAPAAVEAARRGRWLPWALRDTPPEIVRRWFHPRGRFLELAADVRAMVTFEVKNLLGPEDSFWAPGRFDVVFCRNVLMYLARGAVQATVTRFERALAPGGYLFLGHAETLRGFTTSLELVRDDDAFYYRRPAGGSAGRDLAHPGHNRPGPPDPVPELRNWERERQRAEDMNPAQARLLHANGHRMFRPVRAPVALREATPPALPAPVALIRRAVALVDHGELAEAEAACRRARDADDLDPVPHYLLALCRERAGDLDGAVRHATAAAYLDPTFAMPCLHLALLAKRSGDPRTARRELERALALLAREDDARLRLLGGGLDREALVRVCCAELGSVGALP